jgi:predicted nucleic acid-binding protein
MKYVLDASVAVAALRSNEPHHARALNHCMKLFSGRDEIVVPAIFDVEVTTALVRRGADPARVEAFLKQHLAARTLVTIGPRAAASACALAARTGLRAADLLYVWVAARKRLTLVTLDGEVAKRAAGAGVSASAP